MFGEDQLKWYDKVNRARPTHIPHGVSADNVETHMRKLKPYSWKLEGNVLVGMTDMGPLKQRIPTDVILIGTDDEGLPIFSKVILSK
jgi:hypothetical protein